jgi:subtilisin family serine protease
VDRNHLYRPSSAGTAHGQPLQQIAWPTEGCGKAPRLGMIDTGIDRGNPALAGAAIAEETVRGPGLAAAGRAHGTAVASLLVGQGEGAARGLLPRAELVAVDAFHRRPDGDAADAFDLASALLLLAERGVAVANLSVAGPANRILDLAGRQATQHGMLAVAAAGNDGAGQRRYPAAYPWAIAATAVDARGRVYARAAQGRHIAFAAPGVGVPVVSAQGGRVLRSGTSYATPFVTAALALARAEGAADPVARIAAAALDLGQPGRDRVFGWGLVRADGLCAPADPVIPADLPG